MKTRANLVLAAVCVCAGVLPAWAAAPLAERLPGRPLVYVGSAGRNLPFDGSMVWQLLNEPLVTKALSAAHDLALRDMEVDEERRAFGHAWEMGRIAIQHTAAAVLIDLAKGEDGPMPTGALLVDLGKDREAFAKQLDGLLDLIKEDMPFAAATVGKVPYHVHKPRHGPHLAYGYLENVLFVTVGEGAPAKLLNLAPTACLSKDARFSQCMKAVGDQDVQFGYYVDTLALTRKIEQLLPPGEGAEGAKSPAEQVRQVVAALGLERVSAVAGTMRVVGRGMYCKARIFSSAPHRGLLLPLAGAPITDAELAVAPADTDILAVAKVSPAAVYDELRRVIKAIEPSADEQLARELGQAEDDLGLSLRRDVLTSLGETWVLSMAPSRGGFLTSLLLTAQVKDAAKLSAAIRKIEAKLPPPTTPAGEGQPPQRRSGPSIQVLKAGRLEIHYLAVAQRHGPWPVAPAWAIHKGRLYLAGYPQVIQAAVAQNGAAPITQDATYRKARSRLAGKPSMLVYSNVPKITRQVYHWGLIGWTLAANTLAAETGAEVQPAWLPPLSSVEKYLRPQICAVSSDAKGISFEGHGSFPGPSFVGPILLNPAVVWAAMPTVHSAQTAAIATVEMNELRQVAMALAMYQTDHGKLPDSLKDPKLKTYLAGKMAQQVASGRYEYVGAEAGSQQAIGAGRRILVYIPRGPGRPFVLVAFADGHVARMPWASFERMLKAQLDAGAAPARPRD